MPARYTIAVCAVLFCSAAAMAQPRPPSATLRNNLDPGFTTQHRISRTIRRTASRGNITETLVYSKRSEWVRCNVDESKPGQVKIYQMIVDGPVKVLKLFEDKKEIKPAPSAARFNLMEGSTTLYDSVITPTDGPYLVPATEPAEQAVLRGLLDFNHWPRKKVEAGGRWERDVNEEGFRGTQTFEYVDMVDIDGQKVARITLLVEGDFTEPLADEFKFDKTQAVIFWSRLDRCLKKIEAQSTYHRTRAGVKEEYDAKIDVSLIHTRALTEPQQEENLRHLNAFAAILTDFRAGQKSKAATACRAFLNGHPDSLWTPAFVELEQRAAKKPVQAKRLTDLELREALAKCVIAWEAARNEANPDLLGSTRKALEQMTSEYGARLRKLTEDADDAVRASAVFAMAFGSRPADLGIVTNGLADKSPRVRAMALIGFAARRTPPADPTALLAALGDGDAAVRGRACQAVAACIPPEHAQISTYVDKLHEMIKDDTARGVKSEAARAIAVVGAPVDIAKLEKALEYEADQGVRRDIQEAIKKLKAKG